MEFQEFLMFGASDASSQLVLRNPSTGNLRTLDIYLDPVLAGFEAWIIDEAIGGTLSERRVALLARHLFEVTCDVDDDGAPFRMDALPRCPNCGSYGVWQWRIHEPPEFVTRDIPEATHDSWSRLDRETQLAVLRSAASDFLSR